MLWEPPVPFRHIPRTSHNQEGKRFGSLRFADFACQESAPL